VRRSRRQRRYKKRKPATAAAALALLILTMINLPALGYFAVGVGTWKTSTKPTPVVASTPLTIAV